MSFDSIRALPTAARSRESSVGTYCCKPEMLSLTRTICLKNFFEELFSLPFVRSSVVLSCRYLIVKSIFLATMDIVWRILENVISEAEDLDNSAQSGCV